MGTDHSEFRRAERALWSSVGVDPEERWVVMPGGERVRVQIVGDGPPVLFLHGGSSSGANWAPLVAGLDGLRCLVVDRPGCGLSDPIDGGRRITEIATVERHADRLVADLLNGLELERAHLAATSFGGYVGLRSAAASPDRVDRIVEFGWPIGAPISHAPLPMRIATIPGLGELMTRIPPTRRAVVVMMRQVGLRGAFDAGLVSDEMIDWFLALLRHTETMRNELRANPRIMTPIRGINAEILLSDELLARIDAPVLFVWGSDDPMGGADVAAEFAAMFGNAQLELLTDAGHAPWIDEPDRCVQLTTEFLFS